MIVCYVIEVAVDGNTVQYALQKHELGGDGFHDVR